MTFNNCMHNEILGSCKQVPALVAQSPAQSVECLHIRAVKTVVIVPLSFLSVHAATPSLEDYEQVYIVHTGFAG